MFELPYRVNRVDPRRGHCCCGECGHETGLLYTVAHVPEGSIARCLRCNEQFVRALAWDVTRWVHAESIRI
jgi:uncharacterized paraquat-inducible protein A